MKISDILQGLKSTSAYTELSKNTKLSYCLAVETWISVMGDTDVSAIDSAAAEQFKTSCQTKGLKKALTPTSINIHLRSLKAVLGKAVTAGYIQDNPLSKVKPVKAKKKAPAFITPEDQEKLLDKVENPRLRRLYVFLFNTGCRTSEGLHLKIENVNLATRTASIVVDDDFNTKTGRSRAVPLNDKAVEALTAQIGSRTSGRVWDFTLNYASHVFKKAAREAGMGHLHLYNTRHSAASNLLQKGATIASVASLLGHTSINVVMKHYAHLSAAHLQSTVNLLN